MKGHSVKPARPWDPSAIEKRFGPLVPPLEFPEDTEVRQRRVMRLQEWLAAERERARQSAYLDGGWRGGRAARIFAWGLLGGAVVYVALAWLLAGLGLF